MPPFAAALVGLQALLEVSDLAVRFVNRISPDLADELVTLPAMTSISSSVSLPHFSRTLPLSCCQFPSIVCSFMACSSLNRCVIRPRQLTDETLAHER
jgi:hypothetical protein